MTKRKTIASLEGKNAELLLAIDVLKREKEAEGSRRYKAEKAAEETSKNFGDLKERLHNSEVENGRLRGYLERVHHSDIARDGLVSVDEAAAQRSVPKWPNPTFATQTLGDGFMGATYGERRTHWTNY